MAGIFENITKRLMGGPVRRSSSSLTEPSGSIGDVVDDAGYAISVERSPQLTGRNKFLKYSELLTNTTIIATGVRYFLLLLSSSQWTAEPAKNEDGEPLPGAKEVADFIRDALHDMDTPWARIVRRAALYRFYGFSLQEWTAKAREDGRLGFEDIEPRPQNTIERWDMDSGKVKGVTQWIDYATGGGKTGELYIPRDRLVYVVDDSLHESPEGLGLFRHLVRPAERLRGYEELEELAFETDLRGIPIGRAPLTELREAVQSKQLTGAKALRARSAVDTFVRNKLRNGKKGLVLNSETYRNLDEAASPSTVRKYDVELLRGEANGTAEISAAIQRMNQEIARLLGVEHLMLGSDGTGSLALGQTKLSNFFLIVTSTQRDLAEAFDRDVVKVLCKLNGIPKELHPKLMPEEIDMLDVQALGTLLSDIASAGAPLEPGDPAVNTIRGRVGLPPAPEPDPEEAELDAMLGRKLKEKQIESLDNPKELEDNEAGTPPGGLPAPGAQ
jgi:hypothetical protein